MDIPEIKILIGMIGDDVLGLQRDIINAHQDDRVWKFRTIGTASSLGCIHEQLMAVKHGHMLCDNTCEIPDELKEKDETNGQ